MIGTVFGQGRGGVGRVSARGLAGRVKDEKDKMLVQDTLKGVPSVD